MMSDVRGLVRIVSFDLRVGARDWLLWLSVGQLVWFLLLVAQEPGFVRQRAPEFSSASWDVGAAVIYAAAIGARMSAVGPDGVRWIARTTGRPFGVAVGSWIGWCIAVGAIEAGLAAIRAALAAGLPSADQHWMGGVNHHGRMLAFVAAVAAHSILVATLAKTSVRGVLILALLLGLPLLLGWMDTHVPVQRIMAGFDDGRGIHAASGLPIVLSIVVGLAASGAAAARLLSAADGRR